MKELFENISGDLADSYRLVLLSTGVFHLMVQKGHRWDILVKEADYESAVETIKKYIEENSATIIKDEAFTLKNRKTYTGIWVSLILVIIHLVVVMTGDYQHIVISCGSSAEKILNGELFRTATSLTLHADAKHMLGNIFGITLFGTAVCTITGSGVGWLMILMTGIAGNLMCAFFYRTDHLSIGASTAVFGALGILVGYNFFRKVYPTQKRMKAWLPLGAGMALLAMLGASPHTDIFAHLYGFIAGILLGMIYAFRVKHPAAIKFQTMFLLSASGILIISWIRAFFRI